MAHGNQKEDALLQGLQEDLTEQKFLTLRFRFPFVQAGKRRPDPPEVLQQTFMSAVALLGRDPTAAPAHLFVGGKNLGALAAAQAAASRLRVSGLFFLGFPLHKQDDPSEVRADRLYRVISPMLFLQGARDRHCDLDTLRRTLLRVGAPWQLHVVAEADHTFHVTKKSSRTPEEVRTEVVAAIQQWVAKILGE